MVPEIVVELVESLRSEYDLEILLSALQVARSTFYRWRNLVTNSNYHLEKKSVKYAGTIILPTVIEKFVT